MKDINNFILEKLKINKDSGIDNYDKVKKIVKEYFESHKTILNSNNYKINKDEFQEGNGIIIKFELEIPESYMYAFCCDIKNKLNHNNIEYIDIRFTNDRKEIEIVLEERQ